jgi:hypothetical protein
VSAEFPADTTLVPCDEFPHPIHLNAQTPTNTQPTPAFAGVGMSAQPLFPQDVKFLATRKTWRISAASGVAKRQPKIF